MPRTPPSLPRLSTDELLRRHGFAIALRPKNGEPIWSRWKRSYAQDVAIVIARAEAAQRERDLRDIGGGD